MPQQPFPPFYKGIGISPYDAQGYAEMVGVDVHSEVGSVKSQYAMKLESASVAGASPMGGAIFVAVPGDDIYALSGGGILKRAVNGTYTLERSVAGLFGGGIYFDGYLYYANAAFLGRFDLNTTWDDTFGTLTQTTGSRPMTTHQIEMYVGNGKYLASVDETATYSDNVLDFPVGSTITQVTSFGDDLVLGFRDLEAKICRWDKFSDSFNTPYEVGERKINNLLKSGNSNIIFASIGSEGRIAVYTGAKLDTFKRIPNAETLEKPYAAFVWKSKPYFGINGGIYSIHRETPDLPWAIVNEFPAPTASTNGIVNGISGNEQTLVASFEGAGAYSIDFENRQNGYVTTHIAEAKFNNVEVSYSSLPAGTSIDIETKPDHSDTWVKHTEVVDDTDNKVVRLKNNINNKRTLQAKITLNSVGLLTPVIEWIKFV